MLAADKLLDDPFRYMVVSIFLKWSTVWNLDPTKKGPRPPSIISVFIDIVLKFGYAVRS